MEPIVAPSVLIAGQAASVAGSGSQWTASYVVHASAVPEGVCGFSVEFSDLAGNSGLLVTSVTDGSTVEIDKSAPIMTSVSIVSDNEADATKASVGDTITLAITSSEAVILSDQDVRISGEYATVRGSATRWTAPPEPRGPCNRLQ